MMVPITTSSRSVMNIRDAGWLHVCQTCRQTLTSSALGTVEEETNSHLKLTAPQKEAWNLRLKIKLRHTHTPNLLQQLLKEFQVDG